MPVNNFDFEKADGIIDNVQDMAVGRAPISAQGIFDYVSVMQKGFGIGSGEHYSVEYGVFSPETDVAVPTIEYNESHSVTPFLVVMADADGTYDSTTVSGYVFVYYEWYRQTGEPIMAGASDPRYGVRYAICRFNDPDTVTATGTWFTHSSDDPDDTLITDARYYVTETEFHPIYATNIYWRAGRTYKWAAVWKN